MRVLIVEDEPMLALDLENELVAAGFDVAGVATTVEQGVRKAQTLAIDVAVVDLNLNEQSSAPVAAMLRTRQIPFLFVSGYRPDAIPAGFEAIPLVPKPFNHVALFQRLAKLALPAGIIE
jgi:DNA-binding response OmpR family regulator